MKDTHTGTGALDGDRTHTSLTENQVAYSGLADESSTRAKNRSVAFMARGAPAWGRAFTRPGVGVIMRDEEGRRVHCFLYLYLLTHYKQPLFQESFSTHG